MFSDVEIKLKKRNKILFSRDSQCLQELIKIIQLQNHRTLVKWALDCAKLTLEQFESKYPHEQRPRICLEQCEAWAMGKIKMPIAKQAILDSHAVAKEIDENEYGALCHAIGHAGATVHVETHAVGFPMYELTALVLKYGKDNFQEPVSEKINYYYNQLLYWQENTHKLEHEWAGFLSDDINYNKERLLNEKKRLKKVMIETNRCKLRRFEEKDLDAFMVYRNNEEWMKFQSFKNLSKDEYRKALLAPLNIEDGIQLAIAEKETDNILGDIYLGKKENTISIGYSINPIYSRMGYISEVLIALLPKLKTNYPDCKITASIEKNNIPSRNLLLKLGFIYYEWMEEWQEEVYIYSDYN